MRPKLEVCVDSIESVLAANKGGADRIELCSALEVGGLTPSIGLVKTTQHLCPTLPIYAMIRPRSGDFCYSDEEIEIMRKDIEVLKTNGVNGFVFGILRRDGSIDTNNCKLLLETASPIECTFHRAFDLISNPKESLEEVINLGFTRILTSGQSNTALNGLKNITKLVEWAQNRIQIMAGSGVNEDNIQLILNESKNKSVSMGEKTSNEYNLKVVSVEKVRKMLEIAQKFNNN